MRDDPKVLIFSLWLCPESFLRDKPCTIQNNYRFLAVGFRLIITAHYIWHTPNTGLFSYHRIILIFESESIKPGTLKP